MKSSISKLWKSEDWMAVWIGFIVIAAACVSVFTGSFDLSAAKFSTWHLWEKVDTFKPLSEQFTWTFGVKIIRTFLVLGVLFTAGIKLQGGKIKEYIPAFVVLKEGIEERYGKILETL